MIKQLCPCPENWHQGNQYLCVDDRTPAHYLVSTSLSALEPEFYDEAIASQQARAGYVD